MAAKEDFVSIGFTENGDDVLALRNPVFKASSFEAFTAFSQTSGLVPHIKWLQKQVGENRSTAMSPFQTKVHKRILAALSSALLGLYPKVTVAAMHEPLGANNFDVLALVMTSTHVYHGLPAYGVTQAVYLLGGVCSMFGAPVSTLAGETIKQKVDGLISKDSGTFLLDRLSCDATRDGALCIKHKSPGSTVLIPAGHIFVICGSHTDKDDGVTALRWSLLDTSFRKELEVVHESVNMLLGSYPDLAAHNYKSWQDLVAELISACAKE